MAHPAVRRFVKITTGLVPDGSITPATSQQTKNQPQKLRLAHKLVHQRKGKCLTKTSKCPEI
jgi:hypothetical protein